MSTKTGPKEIREGYTEDRLAATAEAVSEDDGTVEVERTDVNLQIPEELRTGIKTRRTVLERPDVPNLFALLPDMRAELAVIMIGGRPLFDRFGNINPGCKQGDEDDQDAAGRPPKPVRRVA